MINLFCSSQRMWIEIFSKTEKKLYHSKHVRDHKFMTFTWKGNWGAGVCLKICYVFTESSFLKQMIYCHFCEWRG